MSAVASPLLELQAVSKVYRDGERLVTALDHVDLTLPGGAIIGLLGPNGAGKTTLLRICASLVAPTQGHVRIAGHDPVREGPEVRRRLGFLSATTGVYERLTPDEQLRYFGRLHGMPETEIRQRVDELCEQLDMHDYRDRQAGRLSTGMRQKLSIARAFLHDPPVVILDEPTNGLDVVVRQRLLDLLRAKRDPARLIVISTHDLPEAEELCDSFVFIDKGRVIAHGTSELLLAGHESLKACFFAALADPSGQDHHAA